MNRSALDPLLDRLTVDGPVSLHVEPGEYELLKTAMRRIWTSPSTWSWKRERQVILAYLRAYTFYRELSEDEQQFWRSFHRELGLPEVGLTNAQYNALWDVLSSHPAVAAHRIVSGRRSFVGTIDAAWGIRVLRAQELITFFERYYNTVPGQVIDAALLRRLMPAADEHQLRQAPMYDRIFRQMVGVVDYLLENRQALVQLPPSQLSEHLLSAGVPLSEPNPVIYFANKSEHALARLVGAVRQGTRRQYRMRQPQTTVRTPHLHSYVQAILAPGQIVAGEPVVFKLAEERTGPGLEIRLPNGQRAPVVAGQATFPALTPGQYTVGVYRGGQPTGSTLSVRVLPPLEWSLTSRPASEPLLERQWQVGRVTLEDGRFQTFRWQPCWEQHEGRWRPLTQTIPLTIDEHEVTLLLTAGSYGARLRDAESGALAERIGRRRELLPLTLLPLQPEHTAAATWRASLESRPENAVEAEPGRSLATLLDHPPTMYDRVLLEFCHRGRWYRAAAVECELKALLITARLDGHAVKVRARAPVGAVLTVTQRHDDGRLETLCSWDEGGEFGGPLLPLQGLPGWSAVRVEVTLKLGEEVIARRRLNRLAAGLDEHFLQQQLVRGLGWAPLKSG